MKLLNTRRGVLAALAATGLATIAGVGTVSAQGGNGCLVSSTDGTVKNRKSNYRATASRAEFEFFAPMRSLAEEVVLVSSEQGGEIKEGLVRIKALVSLQRDGTLKAEKLQIHWPITAIKHQGKTYNVIALHHEQNIPVGIVLSAGGKDVGQIVLEAGVFPADQTYLDFNAEVSAIIHDAIMDRRGFSVRLVAGGNIFSSIQPESQPYEEFILRTLRPAMDNARRQVAAGSCSDFLKTDLDAV